MKEYEGFARDEIGSHGERSRNVCVGNLDSFYGNCISVNWRLLEFWGKELRRSLLSSAYV